MKIAFVSPEWPDAANGIVAYVRHIGLALHAEGHQVIVLTPRILGRIGFETAIEIRDEPITRSAFTRLANRLRGKFGRKVDYTLNSARSVVRALESARKAGGIDVLEMEETFGTAGHVTDLTDVPVVVREHGPHFLNALHDKGGTTTLDPRRLDRERHALESAAALTTPSSHVLQATRAYYNMQREAHVIPNPVVTAGPDETPWSLGESRPDEILFVGRTDSRKGGDLVLRVFDTLARERPALKLHFVGPDQGFVDSAPGVSFAQYAASILHPDALARVIYHGRLQGPEIAKLRRRARVTLVFSRFEVFPYVCTEALSAGCPLVATRVGGIPEIVHDEVTGLLAEAEDVSGLANQVSRFLDNDELCVRLGDHGRDWCGTVLSPAAVARQSLAVYSRIAR